MNTSSNNSLDGAAEAQMREANAQFQAGNHSGALEICTRVLESSPNNPSAIRLAVMSSLAMRNWQYVRHFADLWTRIAPDDHIPWRSLAAANFELSDFRGAFLAFQHVTRLAGATAENLTALGRYATVAADYAHAEHVLKESLALDSARTDTLFALSRLNFVLGENAASKDYCRRTLETDPSHAQAYAHWVALHAGDVSTDIEANAARLAADQRVAIENRIDLLFALGDCAHSRKDYREAIARYEAANTLSHQLLHAEDCAFNLDATDARRAAEASFFKTSVELQSADASSPIPIFIVGMPRSGTTLIESILDAHSQITGLGERPHLSIIHAEIAKWAEAQGAGDIMDAPPELLANWRRRYFEEMALKPGATHIVDKQPANFQYMAMIRALFPGARIIHISRDPLETSFSVWRNNFSRAWPFSTNAADIAAYYRQYQEKASREAAIAGSAVLAIRYEALVDAPKDTIARMLAHCGLAWSDDCLSHHRNKRPIATFSALAARAPIRKATQAEHYGALLDPFRDALKKAGVTMDASLDIANN